MAKLLYEKSVVSKNLCLNFSTYDGPPNFEYISANQVHGTTVLYGEDIKSSDIIPKADGIVQNNYNLTPAAVKTADCIPLAVIGPLHYGVIHAGWRGISEKIVLANKIQHIGPHTFIIGPHIKSCCYEVSKDFKLIFSEYPDAFFYRDNKIYCSLEKILKDTIAKNYLNAEIITSNNCTCCSKEFNSYRRNKTEKRNWNILTINSK